jgi:hypothetical protein
MKSSSEPDRATPRSQGGPLDGSEPIEMSALEHQALNGEE